MSELRSDVLTSHIFKLINLVTVMFDETVLDRAVMVLSTLQNRSLQCLRVSCQLYLVPNFKIILFVCWVVGHAFQESLFVNKVSWSKIAGDSFKFSGFTTDYSCISKRIFGYFCLKIYLNRFDNFSSFTFASFTFTVDVNFSYTNNVDSLFSFRLEESFSRHV
jgi:hypothetical protein